MNLDEVFSKPHHNQDLCDACLRNPHYLVLHKKIVSRLVASLLLLSFFIFVAGYFLGKRALADDFSHTIEHKNFADQINFALSSLYDKEIPTPAASDVRILENNELDNTDNPFKSLPKKDSVQSVIRQKYLAQLFGGTLKAVTQFVSRLKSHGITVEMRTRLSKTARGKKIQWYQAVTQPFENKSELKMVVAKIKKLEKIKDVTIIPIPNVSI